MLFISITVCHLRSKTTQDQIFNARYIMYSGKDQVSVAETDDLYQKLHKS